MIKETRWQGVKNKIRAVFKLQFHATQANHLGWEVMMLSLVPLDIGKATMKTEKVLVIGGVCYWRNPIYETVKVFQETKTGKFQDKLYNFVVSANGSTTSAIVGEITINLSDYIEVVKPTTVALPLRPSKSGVILHVTIQRMHADLKVRGSGEPKDTIFMAQWTNNNHESDKWDEERRRTFLRKMESTKLGSSATSSEKKRLPSKRTIYLQPESTGSLEKFSSTNTLTTEGSDSSGQVTPRENGSLSQNGLDDSSASKSFLNNNGTLKEEKTILDYLIMECSDHQKSTNGWFASSTADATMVNSMKRSIEGKPGKSKQDKNDQIEKYGGRALPQEEHLDLSELEIQNLITMESNRGEILLRKLNSLKGERDALKRECEELKALQRKTDIEDDSNKLHLHTEVSLSFIKEIKQELQYERNLNANLRLQLNKTQEANSELILAVQDLEEMLEQKNRHGTCINCSKSSIKQPTHDDVAEMNFTEGNSHVQISECEELFETTSDGDDEQYHLDLIKEDIVKVKAVYSLEQKIEDLNNDIDVHRSQQENLQMKFEKLNLEYEILKQENNDLYLKLEQAQRQEPLKMQLECSEHSITINDLEEQVRTLKNKLQEQSRAHKDSLEGIVKANLEQERRATEAEKAQQLMRLNHANIAEKLKEEFETLAGELSSTFHINEKLPIQALTEANEMRMKKCHMEKLLEKTTQDFEMLQQGHELKLKELSDLVDFKTQENEKLLEKLKTKIEENDNQKNSQGVKLKALSEDIVLLEAQVKRLSAEKTQICEQMVQNEKSAREMEQLKNFNKEIETKLHERCLEREMLNIELASVKEEAVKSRKDLQNLQHLVEEKEIIIKNVNAEVETIREGLLEDEMEKETIRKEVFHLQIDLRKKDDTITRLEKKLKGSSPRTTNRGASMKTAAARNKTNKPGTASQGSMEVIGLHEKIKLLKEKLTCKDTALEDTKTSFLKKEKDQTCRIEELEKGNHQCKQQDHDLKHNQEGDWTNSIDIDLQLSTEVICLEKTEEESISNKGNQDYSSEMLDEMVVLKKNNKAVEAELKEMQQRYTEISLRFAEVEGERQQLVMTVRNLKNALKT